MPFHHDLGKLTARYADNSPRKDNTPRSWTQYGIIAGNAELGVAALPVLRSLLAGDRADCPLAAPQDQEPSVQEVRLRRPRLHIGHLDVVEVGAAFVDRSAGGGLAPDDAAGRHQV